MTGAAAQSHGCIRNADPRRTPHAVKGVIDSGGKTLAPDSRRDRPAGRLTSSSMSSTQSTRTGGYVDTPFDARPRRPCGRRVLVLG